MTLSASHSRTTTEWQGRSINWSLPLKGWRLSWFTSRRVSCTPSCKEMCGNIQSLYFKQPSYHSTHRKDTDEDERHITLSFSLFHSHPEEASTGRHCATRGRRRRHLKRANTGPIAHTINHKLQNLHDLNYVGVCGTFIISPCAAAQPEEVSRWMVVGTVSRMPLYIANIYESLSLVVYL